MEQERGNRTVWAAWVALAALCLGAGGGCTSEEGEANGEGEAQASSQSPVLVCHDLHWGMHTEIDVDLDNPLPALLAAAQTISRTTRASEEATSESQVALAEVWLGSAGAGRLQHRDGEGSAFDLPLRYRSELRPIVLYQAGPNRFGWSAQWDDPNDLIKFHRGWFATIAEATDWLGQWFAECYTAQRTMPLAFDPDVSSDETRQLYARLKAAEPDRARDLIERLRDHRERNPALYRWGPADGTDLPGDPPPLHSRLGGDSTSG